MLTLRLYVLRELLVPFVVSVFFFTFILLILRVFGLADQLLKAGVGPEVLGKLILLIAGTLMTLTIPMAFLLGVLIAVGRLTSENEVLAMRVAGISVFRVFMPVVGLSLLLSVVLIAANQFLVPTLLQKMDDIRYQVQYELLTNLQPQRIYSELGDEDVEILLHYKSREEPQVRSAAATEATQELAGVLGMRTVSMRIKAARRELFPAMAEREDELSAEQREELEFYSEFLIFAESGVIEGDLEEQALRIILRNGTVIPLDEETSQEGMVIRFEEMRQSIAGGDEDSLEIRELSDQELTYPNLLERVKVRPSWPPWRDMETKSDMRGVWREWFSTRNEFIQRFTLPFATFAFAMIAVPLAIEIRPRAKSFAFLISIGLMALYYAMFTFAGSIAASGVSFDKAWVLLAAPNVVLAAIGAYLFWRAMWR